MKREGGSRSEVARTPYIRGCLLGPVHDESDAGDGIAPRCVGCDTELEKPVIGKVAHVSGMLAVASGALWLNSHPCGLCMALLQRSYQDIEKSGIQ